MSSEHPANRYHRFRRFVMATYEKHGFDSAMELIDNSRNITPIKYGMKGELIFYNIFKEDMILEPLLDAGVKADFMGIKNGIPTNFDVTTNIKYKEIDDYLNAIQTRGKVYEIALIDIRSEEVIFYPLKFPVCETCGQFSHNILYLNPPVSESARLWDMSDNQTIIRYCPKCKSFKEVSEMTFLIGSILNNLKQMSSDTDDLGTQNYSKKDMQKYQHDNSVSIINYVERAEDTLISGVAENYYVVTDPRDYDGYYDGLMHWNHPLVREIPQFTGFHYALWSPGVNELRQLYRGMKCQLCKHEKFRINAKKMTLTCYRCGLIHDVSESTKFEGYELIKTKRRKSRYKDFKSNHGLFWM